ncbi:hypothetical protein [Simkania sp.]|uniref:hypothetical protein n=1 Tax=Simkania sp. TaxID=34094 RepID=UPI003B515F3D
MLSLIVYGRNDNHGYNYHKRLAVSLNCLAETLSHPGDEIIFIDYCSAQDFPTVIEAVSDTLTEKTKSLLKIYRIRSKKKGSLSEEALCRNVAIRRAHPENPWILSTNVDMIFIPVDSSETLSSIVAKLPEGFYELPRFELPENLWESHFDRLKPTDNLTFLRNHAQEMQLHTIVRRPGFLVYDNPGDFQLMTRDAIFAIDGFDEEMDQGWHLDANLCKRMSLYYKGKVDQLEDKLWGYHCNHTRQESFFHKQLSPENDWNRFIKDVQVPDLPNQRDSWGLKGYDLEQVILKEPQTHAHQDISLSEIVIDQDSFNTLTYESKRIFPHLLDHFNNLPPESRVGYIGHNTELLNLIQEEITSVLTLKETKTLEELYRKTGLIIFDFGFNQKGFAITPKHELYRQRKNQLKDVADAFLKVVRLEKRNRKKIKFIGVNVLYSDFRALFHTHLAMGRTSFLSGISFGYLKRKRKVARKPSLGVLKKQLKFYLVYIAVRFFYRFTDKIRHLTYRSPLMQKVLQLK